jgi:RimJ/RimL family protein N-acetyltransferase
LNVAPLCGLRLRTPRLELRLGSREELVELGGLAQAGIHPPEEMPFLVPWTDRSAEPGFVEEFVLYHGRALDDWRPDDWSLNLLVFFGGQPIGSQSVRGEDFSVKGEVETGSWLGQAYQRQGFGTEMRAAALELAFRRLGAQAAISGSVLRNESSKRVSEKLGYRIIGTSTIAPRGEPVTKYDLRIEKGAWQAPFAVAIEGVDACLALFGVTESA